MNNIPQFNTNYQFAVINNFKYKIIDSTTVLDLESQRSMPGLKDEDYYIKNYQFNWENLSEPEYTNN